MFDLVDQIDTGAYKSKEVRKNKFLRLVGDSLSEDY